MEAPFLFQSLPYFQKLHGLLNVKACICKQAWLNCHVYSIMLDRC